MTLFPGVAATEGFKDIVQVSTAPGIKLDLFLFFTPIN